MQERRRIIGSIPAFLPSLLFFGLVAARPRCVFRGFSSGAHDGRTRTPSAGEADPVLAGRPARRPALRPPPGAGRPGAAAGASPYLATLKAPTTTVRPV